MSLSHSTKPPSRLVLEVIATSEADARAAEAGGADRLELVADLARGGMTPALDLIDAVGSAVTIPVRVMIRSTESHEIVDNAMRRQLLLAADAVAGRGVDGLVCGFLRDGMPDLELIAEVADAARGVPLTFHRAFDDAVDHAVALERLARVDAIDRVLTSGGHGEWPDRLTRLARWAQQGRPLVLAGGGITLANLVALSRISGLREVHIGRAARAGELVSAPVESARVATFVTALDRLTHTDRD